MDFRRVVIRPGQVLWASPDPATGREQSGRRPVLVVSGDDFHSTVTALILVAPVTLVRRHWPNHVSVPEETGLDRPSWVMTEQVRAIPRERLVTLAGQVDAATLAEVRRWITDYLR